MKNLMLACGCLAVAMFSACGDAAEVQPDPDTMVADDTAVGDDTTDGDDDTTGGGDDTRVDDTAADTQDPPDETPPTIVSASPANGATAVPLDAVMEITFSEPIDPNTIGSSFMWVTPAPGAAVLSVSELVEPHVVRMRAPDFPLDYGQNWTMTVGENVADLAGNRLGAEQAFTFTTPPLVPVVTSSSPANNAVDVRTQPTITVQLSVPVDPDTVTWESFFITNTTTGNPVGGAIAVAGDTLTLSNVYLEPSQLYTLTVTTAVTSADGVPLGQTYVASFETVAPMTLLSASPPDGATNVLINEPLVLVFNANIDPTTVNDVTFVVSADNWVENQYRPDIAGTRTVAGNTITFVPDGGKWPEYETGLSVELGAIFGTAGEPGPTGWSVTQFQTVFVDPGYYYRLHTEATDHDAALDYYADTLKLFMGDTEAVYSHQSWYFEDTGNGYIMRTALSGNDFLLEGGDGSAQAFLNPTFPQVYTGQQWYFDPYNPREAGDVQQYGESPMNYYLKTNFQGDDKALTMKLQGGTQRQGFMDPTTASIHQLFWFERLGPIF